MIAKILGWMTSGAIDKIGSQLNQAYQSKLDAKNNEERIDADVRISTLQAQQSVLIAEQGHWATRWIRPAFAAPFILYDAKVVVWDKLLGWGVTDDLSKEFWQLQMIIFGAYFLTRPFEKRQK